MAVQLPQELLELLGERETGKVLATVDENGVPHAVAGQSLYVGDDGNLHYLELFESSRSNRNLVRSIWFDRPVAIAIQGKNGRSFQIKGKPVRVLIAGPVFQQHYVELRRHLGDVDLAAVWVIEPHDVIDESFETRRASEEAEHPLFRHLDRLAKPLQKGVPA